MTCPLCTTAIKKSLKKIDGVTKATVILNSKKATVYFDDKVRKKELLDAIKNVGYIGKIEKIVNQ
jgi:mercuric ion binding protein